MFQFALTGITRLINGLLELDPKTPARMRPLLGKTLQLEILNTPILLLFYFQFHATGLSISQNHDGEIQASIKGTPEALLNSLLSLKEKKLQFPNDILIEGEIEVIQGFSQLAQELDIDWEEQLSYFCGDIIAHWIGVQIRNVCNFADYAYITATKNLTEYLQEELYLMPGKEEMEDFFEDIAILRNDAERSQAKIQRLLDQNLLKRHGEIT